MIYPEYICVKKKIEDLSLFLYVNFGTMFCE